MKIALISPYADIESFGIATLSSCLKKEGHEVKLLFLLNKFWKKYDATHLDKVAQITKNSDLIAISLMTNFFDNAVQITRHLKKDTNIPIIWGGIHPTIRPDECLNYADMVCIGEGEESLVELAGKIQNNEDYRNVEGMYFKDQGKIIKNKFRNLIQNLDSVPFPDYNYGDNYYILDKNDVKIMEKAHFEKYFCVYRTMATRGCPYSCTYCCNNTLNAMFPGHKKVRKRSPENIIWELKEIKNRFNFIERIEFNDDSFFTYSIDQIREFCDKYKKHIKIPFTIFGGEPRSVTREKLSLFVDAGLAKIRLGIQSGSKKTGKIYKRTCTNEDIKKAINIVSELKHKIEPIRYDIILDNPWENEDDLIETLHFLATLPPPYYLYLCSLTLYPETELFKIAKEKGLIKDELNDVYRKYFHGLGKNYFNNIFKLINEILPWGGRISLRTMRLLTNKTLRRLRISHLVFAFLKFQALLLKIDWLQKLKRRISNDKTLYFHKLT